MLTAMSSAGNDSGRSPIADDIEIQGQIAIPVPVHTVRVIFSRAKSNPDPPELGPSSNSCDLQGMQQRCSLFHT
jgi:hypothetical protein